MAAIEVASFDQIATILSQLATNYSNLYSDYFNLFYSNIPADVSIQYYDDAGTLRTITIPNRAKDREYILNGEGNPEGNISALIGSIYQDLVNGEVYIKQLASGNKEGWIKIVTEASLKESLISGSGDPSNEVVAPKGTLYIDKDNASLYIKSTPTGNIGWKEISADTSTLANKDLSNLTDEGKANIPNLFLETITESEIDSLSNKLISKQDVSNLVTTINASSTNTTYPSAKAVYDTSIAPMSNLAQKDLSNLNALGEDHFVGMTQVRDGVFKAPSEMSAETVLTYTTGTNVITLSLISGTKLFLANGVNTNKQRVHELVELGSTVTKEVSTTTTNDYVILYDKNNGIFVTPLSFYFRRVSEPTGTSGVVWFNPNINIYKRYSDGQWVSFEGTELGSVSINSSGVVTTWNPSHPMVMATEDEVDEIKRDTVTLDNKITSVNSTLESSKANISLNNVNNAGKIVMASMPMPSGTYKNIVWDGTNNTTFTADADGWVQLTRTLKSGYIMLYVDPTDNTKDGVCMNSYNTSSTNHSLNVFIPVRKNERFGVQYGGTLTSDSNDRFEFIYAVGSESEASS